MSVNMGQAIGYLDLDTTKFKSGFKSALNDLKTFQSQTATSKDKLAAFSSAATSTGKSLTKGLTVPIAGLGAAAVAVTARFEKGMSEVQAISGATGTDIEKLGDKAKEMGAKTKFSASQSAEAFKYMALAGWDTTQMLDGIEGVMNLAAASGEDLASVSDIVTDSLTAFGMSAEDATHFADVLAKTMSSSNTDVAGLGEAFKYVAPVAGAFGYSVEDVSVALGTMANAGIKSSSMGTALRMALVQLTSPSDTAAQYMEKFGISLYDSQGNTKDLMTVMQDLRGTFSMTSMDVAKATEAAEKGDAAWASYAKSLNLPANEQEKLTALTEMFGARAMPAMLSIIQASDKDFDTLTNKIYDADGAAKNMAKTMMDNLPGSLTLAKSALEGLGIRVGEVMTPAIKKIVDKFTEFVAWLTNASDRTVKFAVAMGTVLASLGPVLLIVGTMTRQVLTLIEAYQALNRILAGKTIASILKSAAAKIKDAIATNLDAAANMRYQASLRAGPITTMISRVLALAAAHKVATAAALGVVGAVIGLAVYMYKTGTSFDDLKNKALDLFKSITGKFPEIISVVSEVVSGIVQQIPAMVSGLMSGLSNLTGPIVEAVSGIVKQLPSMLSSVFSGIGSLIVSGLSSLRDVIPKVAKWWANDMPELIVVGTDMIVNIINGFSQSLPELINMGSNIIVQFIDQFFAQAPQLIEAGAQVVMNLAQGLIVALPQFIQGIVSALPAVMQNIVSAITSNIGPLLTAVVQVLTILANSIIQNIPVILKVVTNIFQSLSKAFLQNLPLIIQSVVTILTTIIQAIISNAPQILLAAAQLMLALVQGILQAIPLLVVAAGRIAIALLQALLAVAGAMVQAGVSILQALWRGIASWVGSLVSNIKGIGKRLLNAVKSGIGNLASTGTQWIQGLWNGIRSKIGGVISSLRSSVRRFPSTVKSAIGNLRSAGSNFIQGLWNGMSSKIGGVISKLKAKLSKVASLAKSIFKLGSPSRLMFQYGVWFMEGLENGMDKAFVPLLRTANRQMEAIVAAYNPLTDFDFNPVESMDQKMIGALEGITALGQENPNGFGNVINQNITIDGAENPAEVAEDLARELKIAMRTV